MNNEARVKEGTCGENHKRFLNIFCLKITHAEMKLLDFAYQLAKYGHRNQFRETDARYFEHVRAVAIILAEEFGIFDVEIIISALLHDILENSYILTENMIKTIFGERVTKLVSAVTKPRKDDPRFSSKEERLTWYFEHVKGASTEVKLIKLADRLHNTRTLGSCCQEKQKRKIKETRKVFFPLIEDINKECPDKAKYILSQMKDALAKLEK